MAKAKPPKRTRARVAQQQHTAEALRESEAHLHAILNSMFAFVGVFSIDGILLEANRAPLEMGGLRREEVIGKPFADSYWWSHSAETQQHVRRAIALAAQGETVREDFPMLTAAGNIVMIDSTFGPLFDAAGKVTQVVGSGVDVTARHEAE